MAEHRRGTELGTDAGRRTPGAVLEPPVASHRNPAVEPGAHRMVIPPGSRAQRADRWATDLSGLSRSHVQRLISEGRLTLGGLPVKSNTIVGGGATLELVVPPPVAATPIPQPEIPV